MSNKNEAEIRLMEGGIVLLSFLSAEPLLKYRGIIQSKNKLNDQSSADNY
ncbi:MAG: hypothetical protein PWP56_1599 [Acetobacterium sp.]|jgi:hypothetical protein|nr:hypothetical protein [Acetobacterium sp.]